MRKTVAFDVPVNAATASRILFRDSEHATILTPMDGHATSRSFLLATGDVATVMSLRPDVRDAIIVGGLLRSNAPAYDFAAWVPQAVRNDIISGKLTDPITRYPQQGEWGDIVVWKGGATVQLYQEFPEDIAFYERIARDDEHTAYLLHFAYTQYNKGMREFVEGKGMSPEDAKAELQRINDEVFKLVLEGAVAILSTGVGISQVNATIRANAEQMASATRRSPRFIQNELEEAAEVPSAPAVNKDISLPSGGRSGQKVKFLTGPPNSAVKGAGKGRVFVTNSKGEVVLDITAERVKPVRPNLGFGDKRPATQGELDLIKKLWGE